MKSLKIIVIFSSIVLFIAACNKSASTSVNTTSNTGNAANATNSLPAKSPVAPEEVASGKELFALNCMKCHQETGKGGKVTVEGKNLDVDDLTSDRMKKKDDAKLAKEILEGAPDDGMPAFAGKLSTEELNRIISHIHALQGK